MRYQTCIKCNLRIITEDDELFPICNKCNNQDPVIISNEDHKLFIRMKKFFDENPEIRENYLYWLENKKIVKK